MKHKLHKMMAMLVAMSLFTMGAWAQEVYTSYIQNADLSKSSDSEKVWNTDGTKGISGGMVKVASGSTFDFSQTITLPAGQYKMTAKAAYRYSGSEADEYAAIEAGTPTHLAKLYAETSSYKYEGDVMNRYDGASDTDLAGSGAVKVNEKYVPNSSDAVQAWFDKGQYVNELVFNVQEDGEVKIGIAKTESPAVGDYANIGAWTLTRLGDAEADPQPEPEPEPEEPGEETWGPSAVGNGKFYLYNVGAKGYLFPANNIAVHASVTKYGGILVELQGSDNVYTVSTNETNAGKFMNDGGWMDGDAYGWTFELVSEGVYKLKSGDNVLYWNGEGSTNTTTGADPGTEASHWMLITEGARIAGLAEATEQNPVDATFFIKNPNISWGNGKYVGGHANFDLSNSPSWKGTTLTDVWGPDTNDEEANIVIEQYGKTFDNYQELKNIPNGVYHLTAKGFYRGNVAPYIYANDEKCELKVKGDIGGDNLRNAGAALRDDEYLLEGTEVLVTDGTLRVGIKSDEKIDWCAFDDFRLTYYGEPEDLAAAELAQKKEAFLARAAKFNDFINNEVDFSWQMINTTYLYPVQDEVLGAPEYGIVGLVDKMDEVTDIATLDNCMAKMDKVEELLIKVNAASVDYYRYRDFGSVLESATMLNEEVCREAYGAYEQYGNYGGNATSVEDIEAATVALKAAYLQFVVNATPAEGTKFDMTDLIQNPDFNSNVDGWTCVKAQHNGGDGYNGVVGIAEIAEWGASSWEASMSQTVTGLPNGKYVVKASWMAASGIEMTFAANDSSKTVVGIGGAGGNIAKDGSVVEMGKGHRGWQYVEVVGVVYAGKLTIAVNSSAAAEHMWSNADAFELYYAGVSGEDFWATEEQKAKLAELIAEAETHVLGFAVGEYAPYANVEAVEAILDARAANLESASAVGLDAMITALETAVWTANTEEMAPIYNGNFAVVTEGANYPNGWTRTNAWGQMQANVEGCDNGTAYYNQPGSLVYGNTGAYLMPLKANTTYRLTFKYRSHEEGEKANKGVVATVALGENSVEVCNAEANPSKTEWKVGEGEFETSEAGNYILTLANSANTWMTDVVLVKISDEDTGISAPAVQSAKTVIYDIHGRRVTEMTKGVYIVNGKKVVKK